MPITVFYMLLSLVQFKQMILTESAESKMDICSKTICKDRLFSANVNDNMKSDPHDTLLNTAPCPPPWEMSLLFSASLCLGCNERIRILKRCLKDWDLEIDCKNILSCDDCIPCEICGLKPEVSPSRPKLEVTNRYYNQTTTKPDEPKKENNPDTMLTVGSVLIICFMITAIIIVPIVCFKRRCSGENRYPNLDSNVETRNTLLKQDSVDHDGPQHMVTGKFLDEKNNEQYSMTQFT